MCGRYYIDDETYEEIENLVYRNECRVPATQTRRDIYPTEEAPVIYQDP